MKFSRRELLAGASVSAFMPDPAKAFLRGGLTTNAAAPPPNPFVGSGDIKVGATAFFSIGRAYSAAYASSGGPAFDLTDAATGTNSITINVLSSGLTDVASAASFVAAHGAAKCKKLYDQSGNGNHCSQTNLSNMPNLLLSHPALGNAPIPVLDFQSADNHNLVSAGTSLNQPTGTFSIISRRPFSQGANGLFGGLIQAGSFGPAYSNATNMLTMFAGNITNIPASSEIFIAHQTVFNGANSFAVVNGVAQSAVNPGANNLGSPFTIGQLNNALALTGQIGEIRFDNSVWTSTDCSNEYANQLLFWFNRTAYEGIVANRCRNGWLATADTNFGFLNARTAHIATENLTAIRPVFYWRTNQGTLSVTASIEFPAGIFTQVQFDGSTTFTGLPGFFGTILGDYVSVSIPLGATFWVRQFQHNTEPLVQYYPFQNSFFGEACQLSATSVPDLTMGGMIPNSGAFCSPCHAVIGVTTNKSLAFFGDSIAFGVGDVENTTDTTAAGHNGIVGFLPRYAAANGTPFINLGVPSEAVHDYVIGQEIFPFTSHAISQGGTNDFFLSSLSSASLETSINSNIAIYKRPSQKLFQGTIIPRDQSSDGFITLENQSQSVPADEIQRLAFNAAVRGGTSGLVNITSIIDLASVVESGLNSGLWLVTPTPPYTADGTHPNVAGHTLLAGSSVLTPLSA